MPQSSSTLPPAHQTMLLAHRAMLRDLDRVARTTKQLAVSPDSERAAALREYVDKLFQVIDHHHEGEDDYLWPQLRERGADEAALALMFSEHAELSELLHAWHDVSRRLGTDTGTAAEFAGLTEGVREQLTKHAGDEERELSGRLAPVLDDKVWKGFATHMRKTAPGWTLRFMPAWLSSVAEPDERSGVPAAPVARLFRGWLEKTQRRAFGDNY